jgi:hypothetical protein
MANCHSHKMNTATFVYEMIMSRVHIELELSQMRDTIMMSLMNVRTILLKNFMSYFFKIWHHVKSTIALIGVRGQ